MLSALAEKLPVVLPEALSAAQAIRDETDRAWALSALAEKFPEVWSEALIAAQAIRYDGERAQVLSALVEKFPETLLPEALSTVQMIGDEQERAQVLSAFAPQCWNCSTKYIFCLSGITRPKALWCLTNLIPVIHKNAGQEVIESIAEAVHDVCHWWQ